MSATFWRYAKSATGLFCDKHNFEHHTNGAQLYMLYTLSIRSSRLSRQIQGGTTPYQFEVLISTLLRLEPDRIVLRLANGIREPIHHQIKAWIIAVQGRNYATIFTSSIVKPSILTQGHHSISLVEDMQISSPVNHVPTENSQVSSKVRPSRSIMCAPCTF